MCTFIFAYIYIYNYMYLTHCNKLHYTAHLYQIVTHCNRRNLSGRRCWVPITVWWPRLVGPFKLQVSCAEYNLFYRALLQKRPIICRSLLIEATPYCIWSVISSQSIRRLLKIIGLFCKRAL